MITLHDHLLAWFDHQPDRQPVAAAVMAIAQSAERLASVIAQGPLAAELSGPETLDRYAARLFFEQMGSAGVAAVVSEELAAPRVLNREGLVSVAIDPLDGTGNVDIDGPMGTVFSVLPAIPGAAPEASFLVEGMHQLAAGFVLYGPYTVMALTLGRGTHIFILDAHTGYFVLLRESVRIPSGRFEYAINASNGRFWPLAVRAYIEECLAGSGGPRGVDYNTRWLGAVVSEAYRILVNGGIYLYPGDSRPEYRRGKLRLLYEVNPIAMLVLQAGGKATDGYGCVLNLLPTGIHEQAPLIFGSAEKVERVMALYAESVPQAGQRPLFASRGLFQS